MWGTTSFFDELTDDFGGAFETTSIDGWPSDRLLSCKQHFFRNKAQVFKQRWMPPTPALPGLSG